MSGDAYWLYGSHSRGDADAYSDVDILLVSDGRSLSRNVVLPNGLGEGKKVSRYSWMEIVGMAKYGSLFLHHVRLEGKPLYEEDECRGTLCGILESMPKYQKGARDVKGFKTVLDDVRVALQSQCDEPFELSVLATVIRHASILLCWIHGMPQFGRTRPVRLAGSIIGVETDWMSLSCYITTDCIVMVG